MFNIGTGEIVVIAVVALLVLGPKRLPELARGIGKFLREFRRQTDEVRGVVEREFYKMDNEINAPPVVKAPLGLVPSDLKPDSALPGLAAIPPGLGNDGFHEGLVPPAHGLHDGLAPSAAENALHEGLAPPGHELHDGLEPLPAAPPGHPLPPGHEPAPAAPAAAPSPTPADSSAEKKAS